MGENAGVYFYNHFERFVLKKMQDISALVDHNIEDPAGILMLFHYRLRVKNKLTQIF